ncbi:MAG TPA: N-acetyl-gamma-glutamyl-phosphate reductase [Lactobacillus sp.]|nr:N-acetyl-gamma-glutamyl-phosphate reductase [Lactobacillus sp.]
MNAAIIGVTGYSGTVLYQLLSQHPAVENIHLYGHQDTAAPRFLNDEIEAFCDRRIMIEPYDVRKIMAENDVVFFATPAGVTAKLAQPYLDADFPVIDLSGDMRLKDPKEYAKWYHKDPAPADQLAKAQYGLAEFNTVHAGYVANPGCYATATLLGLAPLIKKHLIDPDSIIVDAKSGLSGAGKKLTTSSHFAWINENSQPYKVNQHQHIPEILQQLQQWDASVKALQFTTTLIPVTRGIMASIYAKPLPGVDEEKLTAAFEECYGKRRFVRLIKNGWPSIKEVSHSNFCDLGWALDHNSHTILVVSVIDNLMKGAAGQAVQNLNHMFELDETLGLPMIPNWP